MTLADGRPDRAAVRLFRPGRGIPATIAAFALLAIGLLAALEIVSALLGAPAGIVPYRRAADWAMTTSWNDTSALVVSAVVAALGLLLLLIALVPGRSAYVPLRTDDPETIIGMRRRSFADAIAHAARSARGARDARARMRGGRVRVTVTTAATDVRAVHDTVLQAVSDKIDEIDPVHRPRVDLHVRRG